MTIKQEKKELTLNDLAALIELKAAELADLVYTEINQSERAMRLREEMIDSRIERIGERIEMVEQGANSIKLDTNFIKSELSRLEAGFQKKAGAD